jgi:hypothetical protein
LKTALIPSGVRIALSVRSIERLASSSGLANAATLTGEQSFFGMTAADDITMSHLLHRSAATHSFIQMQSKGVAHCPRRGRLISSLNREQR